LATGDAPDGDGTESTCTSGDGDKSVAMGAMGAAEAAEAVRDVEAVREVGEGSFLENDFFSLARLF
jgi:hypothetical protein